MSELRNALVAGELDDKEEKPKNKKKKKKNAEINEKDLL